MVNGAIGDCTCLVLLNEYIVILLSRGSLEQSTAEKPMGNSHSRRPKDPIVY